MKLVVMTAAVLVFLTAPCCSSTRGDDMSHVPEEELVFPGEMNVAESFAGRFYTPAPFQLQPNMPSMGLPVSGSDIFNLDDVLLKAGFSQPPRQLLEEGFAVYAPFYSTNNPVRAFQTVESWDQPVYVSAGIPLHLLHIFFDQILQSLEEDHFARDLRVICQLLYNRNLERGATLNCAFYAVPLSFLDRNFIPDPSVASLVERELELIGEHAGFEDSPVMGYREDYSQYVPRGHYTANSTLENYFRAMMWLGRLTFLVNGGQPHGQSAPFIVSEASAREMTLNALLTVSDLEELEYEGEKLLDKWSRIYEITAFFAGFADDLSVPQYAMAARETAGDEVSSSDLLTSEFYPDFRNFVNSNFSGPAIYSGTGELVSMPDQAGEFDPGDLQEGLNKTLGFRFMGQRYTPDSEILGKLVFPSVGMNGAGENRYMPSGLDVAAVFGSQAAEEILRQQGEFEYAHYADSIASLSEMIASYSDDDWHATLYMSWLHCLYLLQQPRGEGYPDFMQTDGWGVHTLSNFLASWAMLRHDTILYAKQSYTMEAGCAPGPWPEPVPSAGFVEPVPEVYAELGATLEMARSGLQAYGVLDSGIEGRFDNAIRLMNRLQDIAERELAGQEITPEDADFLKGFAGYLENAICWDGETEEGLETSMIADVHTDQNSGRVLEVASGDLEYCMVVYMRPDGNVEAAVGPVLGYYEFTWPMSDRLTDEAWREMLTSDQPPERPSWVEVTEI